MIYKLINYLRLLKCRTASFTATNLPIDFISCNLRQLTIDDWQSLMAIISSIY